jgi:hypothetical protein
VKSRYPYRAVAVWCLTLFALAPCLPAQEATVPRHTGFPQDWSQRHIVFSRDGILQHPEILTQERRVFHQALQRWHAPNSNVVRGVNPAPAPAKTRDHRDWNVALAGRISANMFPAKFSFDPAAPPDCVKDYVVFGLNISGITGGRPNLVAFNNLYVNSTGTGFCSGTVPNVLFAYNITTVTAGKIVTSPALSEDGTKIGFIETVTGATPSSTFHVLTWTAGQGTLAAAAAPAAMTSLTIDAAKPSTTSAPWVDYGSDNAYLGTDSGKVYKILGTFKGTPALATSPPWPVTVSTNILLTPPVLDNRLHVLMVGSHNGSLYQINTTTGALSALVVGKSGGVSPGIMAAPIVDVTNGTTFVVSANDGTSAVLVEADTNLMTQLVKSRIGLGSSGVGGTPLALYEPAFTDQYYGNPSNGNVRLCGTGAADTTPWQYAFGFTGRMMNTTATFKQQIPTIPAASTAARCTGWTEFFNPNVGVGGTDFFFFGLTQDCTAAGLVGGCVAARTSNGPLTTATLNGGPSGIVVDNYYVDPLKPGTSSIYLTAAKVSIAYKFTQNGLQ